MGEVRLCFYFSVGKIICKTVKKLDCVDPNRSYDDTSFIAVGDKHKSTSNFNMLPPFCPPPTPFQYSSTQRNIPHVCNFHVYTRMYCVNTPPKVNWTTVALVELIRRHPKHSLEAFRVQKQAWWFLHVTCSEKVSFKELEGQVGLWESRGQLSAVVSHPF